MNVSKVKDRVTSVDAVLTCYNEGSYIASAVQSILDQTATDRIASITIADDGSDEDTQAILRDLEKTDPRITVLYGPGGAGLARQRNIAIAHGTSAFVAILDGDDLWVPDKLEKQLFVAASRNDIGLIYSGYAEFSDDPSLDSKPARVRDITSFQDLELEYFLNDPPIIPSTTLFERRIFDLVGGFDERIRVFEDTDFYMRVIRVTRLGFTPEILLYKRVHAQSITQAGTHLMAHHAFVAFKAAAESPRLARYLQTRLSERARKYGNQKLLGGAEEQARYHLAMASRLNPLSYRAVAAYVGVLIFPTLSRRLALRLKKIRGRRLRDQRKSPS